MAERATSEHGTPVVQGPSVGRIVHGGRGTHQRLNTIPQGVGTTIGEGGRAIPLLTNFYKLNTPKNEDLYAYRVDFEPQVESARMRGQLIRKYVEFLGSNYVFDGGNCIYSTEKLESDVITITGTREVDNEQISITIRYTSTVPWGHQEMVHMYNAQMKKNFRNMGMIPIGRDYFDMQNRVKLDNWKLQICPGMMTAINEHDGGILMVCDTVHKVIRSQTAYDVLHEMLKADHKNFRSNAREELAGKIIMTNYNNRRYRIDDVVFDKNPNTYTFERRGQTFSLTKFFFEQHGVAIRDEKQPLLVVKPTERQKRGGQDQQIVLIPELCLMTGLTDQMRKNFQLKKDMKNATGSNPKEKVKTLETFMRKLDCNEKVKSEMAALDLNFDNRPVEVTGRVLPAEKIFMFGEDKRSGTQFDQKTGSFEHQIRSKKMRKPIGLDKWAIVCLRRDEQIIDDYCDILRRVFPALGVNISPPKIIFLDNDRTSTYIDACRKIPTVCQLVNVIVPNCNQDRYDAIKQVFCCEHPMASQVVTTRILQRKNNLQSICTKIAFQMSVKLGAEAWTLEFPPKNVMTAGFNCYYDSSKRASVGALVCSLNDSQTRWYSRASYHQSSEQLTGNLFMHLKAALKEYKSLNGRFPDRLLFYRGGVSEGEIVHIHDIEIGQIRDALNSMIEPGKIQWAFILVNKRENARFFHQNAARFLDNPPPGTIVDSVVTREERYDFFLISQCVRQGTVNPTMYNIIQDTTGWRPIHHQQMVYKLCHLYFNWAGTISVPAACQYAQKLAYLTATSLHREADPKLWNFLYYLGIADFINWK